MTLDKARHQTESPNAQTCLLHIYITRKNVRRTSLNYKKAKKRVQCYRSKHCILLKECKFSLS